MPLCIETMKYETVETDVFLDGEEEPLHIEFKADFYSPKAERAIKGTRMPFNELADNIANNLVDWDLQRYKRDAEGNIVMKGGEPVLETVPSDPETVRAVLDIKGSDFLEAIHKAMWEATTPNPKTSES